MTSIVNPFDQSLPWSSPLRVRGPAFWSQSDVVDYWSAYDVATGAVPLWVGKKGAALAQGTAGYRPTRSATSFNSRPGVTFDGTDDYLSVSGVSLSGSKVVIVLAVVDTTAAASVIAGFGNPNTDNGSFEIHVNAFATGKVDPIVRGSSSYGCRNTTAPLTSAVVLSVRIDTNSTNGVDAIRVNSTEQALATQSNTNVGASLGANLLKVGGRDAAVLPWAGVLGGFALVSGSVTDARLTEIENEIRVEFGL